MSKEAQKNDIQLLDALIVMAKYKMLIIKLVVSITLIALIISLIWPKSYKSTAIVLPPVQDQPFGGISGMLSGMMPMGLGARPHLNPETILTILNSRSLRVEAIEHFDLYKAYNSTIVEEILIKLDESVRIEETRDGGFGFNPISAVQISVTDGEPEMAQRLAAFFVRRLDEKINEINRMNALEQFEMIEERFERNLQELEIAEIEFKEFQERYGIIEVEEQARAMINTLAEVKAQSIETEIAINVMRQSVSENNPELRSLLRTKSELDRTYNEFIRKSEQQARNADVMYPLLEFPELALQYYRYYREVTVQNKVYETLYPQYDYQKLISETDRRGIQILDEAHLPTYKDGPKRAFIVLGGMVFSIFLSLLIVFYKHTMAVGRENDSQQYRKINEFFDHMRFQRKKQL